ncbi:serine/threonine protein kinase [bacterium]|nr:serine/threonine protein kinase [bacterium]
MGVIYRAFDRVLRRPVAIKMRQVRPGRGDDPVMRGQFVREARVAGRLFHPNVIPVFDLGTDQLGQLYYTMRLVEGMNLERCLDALSSGVATRFTEFPLRRLVEAFVGVCRGVDYAHESRILHLDLKPQNVLVSGFSEVFVIDWGLAREEGSGEPDDLPHIYSAPGREETGSETRVAGRVIGTPAYMAPEQSLGDPSRLTPATDVYALGGILHFILGGVPPNVNGATPTRTAPPLRPGIVPRGLQLPQEHREAVRELIKICLRALEIHPANRYPDADGMVADLTDWLQRTRGVIAQ